MHYQSYRYNWNNGGNMRWEQKKQSYPTLAILPDAHSLLASLPCAGPRNWTSRHLIKNFFTGIRPAQFTELQLMGQIPNHTPSITFRHLPPNSARFSYATEGALFIFAQLSTDTVSALRKVRVLIRLWKQPSAQARM